ncbi:hypothetical protein EVAR_43418_1 [Eumeta japonica]|uniref:Uncharacterized protein n=1 Tax=Eumeta variegata TaxID=151549 RepID=A0A4C1WST0_EUMVA|nr:hypothetical protein EVAR_43418_1 [Eumeta japonica]
MRSILGTACEVDHCLDFFFIKPPRRSRRPAKRRLLRGDAYTGAPSRGIVTFYPGGLRDRFPITRSTERALFSGDHPSKCTDRVRRCLTSVIARKPGAFSVHRILNVKINSTFEQPSWPLLKGKNCSDHFIALTQQSGYLHCIFFPERKILISMVMSFENVPYRGNETGQTLKWPGKWCLSP